MTYMSHDHMGHCNTTNKVKFAYMKIEGHSATEGVELIK
jgi:hypothetical protein